MPRSAQPEWYAFGRRALLAGGAAVLLAGCGVPKLPGLGGSKGTKPDPTGPPEKVTLTTVWDTSGLGQIDDVSLAGNVVVLSGGLKGGQGIPFLADLAAYSVADRKRVWTSQTVDQQLAKIDPTLSLSDGLVVCGSGSGAIAAVPTYQNPCPDGKESCSTSETTRTDGKGLAAIRVSDGHLLWHNLLLPAVSRSDPQAKTRDDEYVKVIAGDGRHLLYIAGANEVVNGTQAPSADKPAWTGILDAATGKPVWRRDNVIARYLAGDVVLVELVGSDQAANEATYGPVATLDAQSGRQLWSSRGTSSGPGRWRFGGQGFAGLEVGKSATGYKEDLLLDPRTGETLHTEKKVMASAAAGIGPGGNAMAVWFSPDGGLFAGSDDFLRSWTGSGPLRTGTEKLSNAQTPTGTMVAGGRIWATYTDYSQKDAPSKVAAMDLWGRQLCTQVSGQASGASADHLVVLGDESATVYTVS